MYDISTISMNKQSTSKVLSLAANLLTNLQKINFVNFCSPDSNNIKIHRLFVKKQYQQCRNIIEVVT